MAEPERPATRVERSYLCPTLLWQVNAAGERIAGPWPFSDPPPSLLGEGVQRSAHVRAGERKYRAIERLGR
jgi:hypothetical protein